LEAQQLEVTMLRWLCPAVAVLGLVTASSAVAEAAPRSPLRFSALEAPARASAFARSVSLRVAASRPATLRVGGRRYRVAPRVRRIVVPVRPGVGALGLRLVLRSTLAVRTRRLVISRPRTVWQAVLDRVKPDGSVPPQMALQAFSVAIGPLPGVEVPRGPTGQVGSATGAIGWLRANFDRITPAQRAAAGRALARLSVGARVAAARPPREYLRTLADVEAQIEAHFGELPVLLTVTQSDSPVARNSDAFTDIQYTNGEPDRCDIVFTRRGDGLSERDFTATMAHEYFHCQQAVLAGANRRLHDMAPWLVDGSAEWVADQVTTTLLGDGGQRITREWLDVYLSSPEKRLFQRTYDGHGFFAELAWHGIDPWTRLADMITADGSSAAFTAAVRTAERTFLGAWGASFMREPGWGHDWDVQAPSMPSTRPRRAPRALDDGGATTIRVDPLASSVNLLRGDADVVTLTVAEGVVRTRDKAGREALLDASGMSETAFCTMASAEACACPPGSTRTSPTAQSEPIALALTGDLSGGRVTLRGTGIDEYCGSPALQSEACRLHERSELERVLGGAIVRRDSFPVPAIDFVGPAAPVLSNCSYGFKVPPVFDPVCECTFSGDDFILHYAQWPTLSLAKVKSMFAEFTSTGGWRPIRLRGFDAAAQRTSRIAADVIAMRKKHWLWFIHSSSLAGTTPSKMAERMRGAARLAAPRLR
jgi:hypothetical protein